MDEIEIETAQYRRTFAKHLHPIVNELIDLLEKRIQPQNIVVHGWDVRDTEIRRAHAEEIQEFLMYACVPSNEKDAVVATRNMYNHYVTWCERVVHRVPMAHRSLSNAMVTLGYKNVSRNSVRGWYGLMLKDSIRMALRTATRSH